MSNFDILPGGKKQQNVAITEGSISVAGADGAILDGANSSIKASVLDYTNSNPVAVRLTDTNGDYVSSGGGTEYTEDAAAAANPVGKANILVRQDTPGALVSNDGDNVAQRGTNYGAAYVQIVDSSGNYVNSFGGGTQYTEGDVDASITGTASLGEAPSNTLQPLQLDASNNLKVAVQNATIAVTQSGTWDEVGINDSGNSITVDDGGTSLTVDGTVTANLAAGTNNIGDVDVLSVPAPLSTTGGGTEATALRVTIANDSTGLLSVDDNGGSLTIDGTVAATQSGAWNITNISGTISLPTGAATETSLAKLTQSTSISQASTNISTTAQIVASNASRKKILIKNPVDAADFLYIGASGVTTANGFPLLQGESIMLDTTAAVHGVAGSGTIAVKTIEFT